jgi:hypothetical protein
MTSLGIARVVPGANSMPGPHALVVRLPSGTEYWYAQEVPEVGEFVSRFGTRYVVLACEPAEDERTVVTLAEEEVTAIPLASSPLT